jgi:hypothetical protein
VPLHVIALEVVFMLAPIAACVLCFQGQFVCEYVGDLIDEAECKRRLEAARSKNMTNFYMLTLDKNR